MQIRYSFSSMVLPAAGPRGGKRGAGGAPQDNKADAQAQGKPPGAPHSEPAAGKAASAVRSASGFLLSAREHVKVGGPGVGDSPASCLAEVGPPGTRRFKVKGPREEIPRETARIRSPGRESGRQIRTCPVAGEGRGKKRDFQKNENECTKVTSSIRL